MGRPVLLAFDRINQQIPLATSVHCRPALNVESGGRTQAA